MIFRTFTAPEILKTLVFNFWILETEHNEVPPSSFQAMADGCALLVVPYGGGYEENRSYSAYIRGQQSIVKHFHLEKTVGLFGVRLFPHAVPAFFGVPAPEISNETIDLSLLLPKKETSELTDRILTANSNRDRIDIMSSYLINKLRGRTIDSFHIQVRTMIEKDGLIDLTAMKNASGLSLKQFERRFAGASGFTPKYYSRILRFNGAKRSYRSGSYPSFVALAYDFGYCDHSHFIREFKEFSGSTVRDYFSLLEKDEMQNFTCTEQEVSSDQLNRPQFKTQHIFQKPA
jgi:AraC-like DNA-binding protein